MNCKLVFLVIAALALAQANKTIGILDNAASKTIIDGVGGAGSFLVDTAVGLGSVGVNVVQSVANGEASIGLSSVLGHLLFGHSAHELPPLAVQPEEKAPKTIPLPTIDWAEIGFSYFNGRVFTNGSAEIRKVLHTRDTIAALLSIETVGLESNAKLNIKLRRPEGKGSVDMMNFTMPLCALSSLNKKALMLTLGLKYITLPVTCPMSSGVFNLSYYYKIGGIDFFKGLSAGNYKIEFEIAEDNNVLLKFFWRVVIKTFKEDIRVGDDPTDDNNQDSSLINPQVDLPYIQIDRTNDNRCNITQYNMLPINCDQRIYPVVHGWTEGLNLPKYQKLVKELIAKNYNSYLVDWQNIAANIIYPTVDVEFVGNCLGQYLTKVYQKCRAPSVHLTGHSIGAHVVGCAGRALKRYNFLADTITGLDPAGLGFYLLESYASLSPNDASQVFHMRTNAFMFGTALELGSVTFYANNGMFQAGCPFDPNINSPIYCNHGRSMYYHIEAIISNNFVASKCDTLLGVVTKKYPDQNIIYNLDIPQNISGTYCFDTNSLPPYGKGTP